MLPYRVTREAASFSPIPFTPWKAIGGVPPKDGVVEVSAAGDAVLALDIGLVDRVHLPEALHRVEEADLRTAHELEQVASPEKITTRPGAFSASVPITSSAS